jgi:hypothetical protein
LNFECGIVKADLKMAIISNNLDRTRTYPSGTPMIARFTRALAISIL